MQSPLPPSSQPKKRHTLGSLLGLAVLLGLILVVLLNHQYLTDTISFWRFKPTAEIAQIASTSEMNGTGKFNFYAAQPSVDDSSAFNSECDHKESGTAILGCYVGQRIYIYNVTDSRLAGIKEVTAAHEMLHAVYERLSSSERDKVNTMVEAEYEKLKSDPSYVDQIAFYDRTEPGQRDNELHSIIGTQIGSLSPDLEAYYSKYFSDRAKLVAQYNTYNSAFTSLAAQASKLSAQLDKLNESIAAASSQYNTDVKTLNADITSFNAKANSGAYSSEAQFNTARQALVVRVDATNAERTNINSMVDQFNALREQYNSTVTQSNDLYKSIDSTSLSPAPKV